MSHFFIKKGNVHLWHIVLPDCKEAECILLLNAEEKEQAKKMHLAQHRMRFVATRSALRKIIGYYTMQSPSDVVLDRGLYGKPYLKENPFLLEFNVSHSHDIAVLAFAKENKIGVDIEKIQPIFKEDVAKRFFSVDEYNELCRHQEEERATAFYQMWARKEAIIKARGDGLQSSLNSFSVANDVKQVGEFFLKDIVIHSDYRSALAMSAPINRLFYYSPVSFPQKVL